MIWIFSPSLLQDCHWVTHWWAGPVKRISCCVSSIMHQSLVHLATSHRLQPEISHLGHPHLTVYSQRVRISVVRTSLSTARVFASRLSAPHSPQPECSHLDCPHLTVHSQRVRISIVRTSQSTAKELFRSEHSESRAEMAAKLETVAHDNIVSNLGKLAESIDSNFCCGGMLNSPNCVKLTYLKKTGDFTAAPVVFPGTSEPDIQQLLDAASVASFGIGNNLVWQELPWCLQAWPRSVLHFIWALQHNNPWWDHSIDCARYTTIPDEITALIVPDIPHLQSELYKLNIYGAPGGHFKAHVDTPRSEQMFGSPVVCLPTCFSGGCIGHSSPSARGELWLVFSFWKPHAKIELGCFLLRCWTWSTSCYCWLSNHSDVQSLQSQVTSVHITSFIVHHNIPPVYRELRSALSNPIFMHDGGVLGFSCHHLYVFDQLKTDTNLQVQVLSTAMMHQG